MRQDDFLNLLFQKAREAGLTEYEAYVASATPLRRPSTRAN
jgi:hypothetical protein